MAEQTSILLSYINIERLNKFLSPEKCWQIVMLMKDFNQGVDIAVDKSDPLMGLGFDIVKEELIKNKKAFEKKCAQNAENGKKGGRGRKKKATAFADDEKTDDREKKEDEKANALRLKGNDSAGDRESEKNKKAAALIARKKGRKPG